MQKNNSRVSSLPQFKNLPLFHPIKRKDPGKTTIPEDFKQKAPKKIVKTNANQNKIAPKLQEKLIKPKIVWKNMNKFNIKQKFTEILGFLKNVMKKIANFLKENHNVLNFINEKKEEYQFFYEKLRNLSMKQKKTRSENQDFLKNVQHKKDNLKFGNEDLIVKIRQLKLKNQEISCQIHQNIQEFQVLKASNLQIAEKHQEITQKNDFVSDNIAM